MTPAKEKKRKKLIELRKKALEDDLPLKEGATNLVFGEGNVEAEIVFIGEGPGHWEDVKARPFVGNAGILLNQMLEHIEIRREDVFITNVIMYRPPSNRDPQPEEIDAFSPYLDGIIKTIDPKMVVTLGRFSMAKFIPGVMISNVHGKPREVEWKGKSLAILPMYHPAAALRNGEVKFKFKRDFENIPLIMQEIDRKDDKIKNDKKDKQMSLV
jgi:DNA polymerase